MMDNDDMDGWDFVWMSGMMLVWVAVILLVVWGAVMLVRRGSGGGTPSPKDELDRRLARGEIDEDEYRRRRDLIGSAS